MVVDMGGVKTGLIPGLNGCLTMLSVTPFADGSLSGDRAGGP